MCVDRHHHQICRLMVGPKFKTAAEFSLQEQVWDWAVDNSIHQISTVIAIQSGVVSSEFSSGVFNRNLVAQLICALCMHCPAFCTMDCGLWTGLWSIDGTVCTNLSQLCIKYKNNIKVSESLRGHLCGQHLGQESILVRWI